MSLTMGIERTASIVAAPVTDQQHTSNQQQPPSDIETSSYDKESEDAHSVDQDIGVTKIESLCKASALSSRPTDFRSCVRKRLEAVATLGINRTVRLRLCAQSKHYHSLLVVEAVELTLTDGRCPVRHVKLW